MTPSLNNHVVSLPSRSGHIALRCCDFLAQTYFLRSSICTSATASVELCSPRGEVPWSIAAVNRRARVSSLAKTHIVSALSAWGFRMHVTRFTGPRNARFARISVSYPSALGLRLVRRNLPFFPVAPQAPPRPLVRPRPGVRMSSSRRGRVSRQASPFLFLPLPSACTQIHQLNSCMIFYFLARGHVIPFPSG